MVTTDDGDAPADDPKRALPLWVAAVGGAVLLFAVAIGLLAASGSGDEDEAAPSTTSKVTAPATTSTSKPPVVLAPAVTVDRGSTATTTPATPPSIDQFDVESLGTTCDEGVFWSITWKTTGADTVTIGIVDAAGSEHDPNGTSSICAPTDAEFQIDADGPGGRASSLTG